jgi:hypothetical protein
VKSDELIIQLESLNQAIAKLKLEMDKEFNEFKGLMLLSAKSWMEKEVQTKIKTNPDVVQLLGKEKLIDLRSKLNILIEKLPELINREFSNREKWPHNIEWTEKYQIYSKKEITILNDIFGNVISDLGDLLNQFGLLKDPPGFINSWTQSINGKFVYRYSLDFPPQSRKKAYQDLFIQYTKISTEINNIKEEIEEAKALELWNQANS